MKRGGKMKNVQIPEELFSALVAYHLVEVEKVLPLIKDGLERKMEALIKRELYSKYKMSATEEEKEQARQAYLDKCGISESFRW